MPSHSNPPLWDWRATSRQLISSGLSFPPSDATELLDAGLPLQTGAEAVAQETCAMYRRSQYRCCGLGEQPLIVCGGQLVAPKTSPDRIFRDALKRF